MSRRPKALITGFTGMVGSHLADHLLAHTDWDLTGLLRWNEDLRNVEHLLDRVNQKDRVGLVYGDLNDHPSLARAIDQVQPDYVFHLAAQSYPQQSFVAPIETLQTNILGTAALLDAIHRSGLRPVVHVCASSEVFGRVGKEHLPIDEETPFHPASPYAISKVGTDLVGRFYAEAYGLCVMTTRMFTHTGPRRGDVFAESTFAKQIALIEEGRLAPQIKVGNLESMRTWADVRDAVRAYHLLVTVNPTPGAYYNIGGSFSCTVGDMLRHLLSLSLRDDIEIVVDPERLRPIDADLQVPDTRKFAAHTGWRPQIPFEQTMADLLEHWRDAVRSGRRFLVR
ncbi:MAG: GDP-mannose 4,6-dehydratase [Planctomycetota bacterium]